MASAPPLPDLDFEAMSAEDVLRWAYSEFGDRMCLTCSWQRQSSVLVHMVSELGLEIPVVELDTLVLFPETTDIWMANPFCFAPTPHRVTAGGRTWTGTCCTGPSRSRSGSPPASPAR